MKRYYLHVITSYSSNGIVKYEVDADSFDYSGSGCYVFYIRDENSNREVVGLYPIDRTIIRGIQELQQ